MTELLRKKTFFHAGLQNCNPVAGIQCCQSLGICLKAFLHGVLECEKHPDARLKTIKLHKKGK